MLLKVAGAVLLSAGMALSAQASQGLGVQAPTPPQPHGDHPQPAPLPSPSRPFSNLFKPSMGVAPLPGAAVGAPRVACGMTLVPVNPGFDPAMRKSPPQKPKPSVKVVPTLPCR